MTITPGERSFAFSTVFNFRDLGGLSTADGRKVKRGKIFRSDNLGRLAMADKDAFAALGVRRVVDLRRHVEVETLGRVPEWTGCVWLHHHLEHEYWDHATYTDEIGVARWLADRYAELLTTGAADIAEVIALLSDVDSGPTIVHCVAGKDRTGLISALVLSLIGVGDDVIAADYALTELSEDAYIDWLRRTSPEEAAKTPPPFYVETPATAMSLALVELRERHGSIEAYLAPHGVSGQHIAALRNGLLE